MTRAELFAGHFARCFREYSRRPPAVRARMERLADTASDPDKSAAERNQALSTLASILFPHGADGPRFGDRVGALLVRQGMSQRKLAASLGVTEATVSGFLSGKHRPQRQTVRRIAAVLGAQPEDLWPD